MIDYRSDNTGRAAPEILDALMRANAGTALGYGAMEIRGPRIWGGRPVVAPASGGPAEMVDESCGRLYSPGDGDAAARALAEVLSAPGQARALGGRRSARARRDGAGRV